MAVWSVPKLGTELLENAEPVLDSLGTVWVVWVLVCQKWTWISVPQSGTDSRRESYPRIAHCSV